MPYNMSLNLEAKCKFWGKNCHKFGNGQVFSYTEFLGTNQYRDLTGRFTMSACRIMYGRVKKGHHAKLQVKGLEDHYGIACVCCLAWRRRCKGDGEDKSSSEEAELRLPSYSIFVLPKL